MINFLITLVLLVVSLRANAQFSVQDFDLIKGAYSQQNLVRNPFCDKNIANLTAGGGGPNPTRTASGGLTGFTDCSWDPTATAQLLTYSLKTLPKILQGQNCEAVVYYSGDASLVEFYVLSGSTKVTPDIVLRNSGSLGGQARQIFPCGDGSSALSLRLESLGNAPNIPYAVYVGPAVNVGSVNQSLWLGSVSHSSCTGGASGRWRNTGVTTPTSYSAITSCTTVASGNALAPTTVIPAVRLNNLAPGNYQIVARGEFGASTASGTTLGAAYDMFDGTTASGSSFSQGNSTGDLNTTTIIVGSYTYTTAQSSVTWQLRGWTINGGTNVADINGARANVPLTFDIYYFPTSTQTAVRMDQTDYNPVDYTPDITGTTESNVSFQQSRRGKFLKVKGRFTSTSPTAAIVIPLPPGMTVDDADTTNYKRYGGGSITSVGFYTASVNARGNDTAMTLALAGSGSNGIAPYTAWAGEAAIVLDFEVPIKEFSANQSAPLVVGGVTSSSVGLERIERVSFGGSTVDGSLCTSTPCTMWRNTPAITSVTRSTTGTYLVNFAAGTWSSIPSCTFNAIGATNQYWFSTRRRDLSSLTVVGIETRSNAGALDDTAYDVVCVGPR